MHIAGTADAFNRQLHQREVDAIKAQAEGFQRFAKQRGIILTEAQAEARLIRTMTRVADKQTTIDDGYRQDELAISYLGHNFIDVTPEDYKTSDINWDVVYNNPQTFANAQLYSGSGLTPQEVETRNNSAGAPVAKVLAASLAAYAVAPYALTAMDSCLLNPVLCVNELGLVAGEVALEGSGLGVTGKSVLKNSGKVPGGSVVVKSEVPKTREALHSDLISKGFNLKSKSNENGYTTYKGPDGLKVDVKPSGEVILTQRVWKDPNNTNLGKGQVRLDYDGNRLPGGFGNQSHQTNHFVEPFNGPIKSRR